MPTFKKLPSGLWQAQIARKGVRLSRSFTLKTQAIAWAGSTESQIIAGEVSQLPDKTFGQLLDRYVIEITPSKRGARWEAIRIALIKRDRLALVRLRVLSGVHVAQWRDRRLQSVSGASVRREWNILSHACEIARKEWHWLKGNPFKDARRPPPGHHRERIFTNEDLGRLELLANTDTRKQVMRLVYFCIETGMRAGEACGLQEIDGNVAHLDMTKNGSSRQVPLSARAIELFNEGWDLVPSQLDANFRKMRKEAGIKDLHFHDSRHSAITQLAKKLDVLTLAKMVGHKNINQLLIYYNPKASDIAGRL